MFIATYKFTMLYREWFKPLQVVLRSSQTNVCSNRNSNISLFVIYHMPFVVYNIYVQKSFHLSFLLRLLISNLAFNLNDQF